MNVRFTRADGTSSSLPTGAHAVLVDAPCSGLGTLGRKKDLRWNKQVGDLLQLHQLQVRLLEAAAALVRPGGRIVYTTCSVDRAENEETVAAFLEMHRDFGVEPIGDAHPAALFRVGPFVRTWPHRHGMGGSFGAVLRKRAETAKEGD